MTGQDDDLLRVEGGSLPAPLPLALLSESRIAAALVMQAQALDAMRRAHSDLLARIEQGPERHELLAALDGLRESAERLREGQARSARRMARLRRRLVVAAVIALLLSAGGGAAAFWAASSVSEGLPAVRADLAAALATQDQARGALGQQLEQDQAELHARVDEALAAQQLALAETRAQRERADAAVAEAAARARERDEQSARADRERGLHLEALGENTRLRGQVIESNRKLEDLAHTVANLQPVAAEPASIVSSGLVPIAATTSSLPTRVTGALRQSGVKDVAIVEVADVRDGALVGLLVLLEGVDGAPAQSLRMDRAELLVIDGRPVLEITGTGVEPVRVAVPALERDLWKRLGVAVPDAAVSVARLKAAIALLVEPQNWTVESLDGWDGTALRGLVLEQADSSGYVTRRVQAAQGRLLPGPELELRDGKLRTGEDERAFYQGVFRLPLPGGDLAAFQAELQALMR